MGLLSSPYELLALLLTPLAPRDLCALLLLPPTELAWLLCPRELSAPVLMLLPCASNFGNARDSCESSKNRSRLLVRRGHSDFAARFAKLEEGGTGDTERLTLFTR